MFPVRQNVGRGRMDISQYDSRPSEIKSFSGDVAALVILIRAWWTAKSGHVGVWQRAVERSDFERAGVPLDALQRLLDAGLIAARQERTGPGARKRSFQRVEGWKPARVCYVLTPAGADLFGSE